LNGHSHKAKPTIGDILWNVLYAAKSTVKKTLGVRQLALCWRTSTWMSTVAILAVKSLMTALAKNNLYCTIAQVG
jgi:hypothetical protein